MFVASLLFARIRFESCCSGPFLLLLLLPLGTAAAVVVVAAAGVVVVVVAAGVVVVVVFNAAIKGVFSVCFVVVVEFEAVLGVMLLDLFDLFFAILCQ